MKIILFILIISINLGLTSTIAQTETNISISICPAPPPQYYEGNLIYNIYKIEEAPHFEYYLKRDSLEKDIALFKSEINRLITQYLIDNPFQHEDTYIVRAYIKIIFDKNGIIVDRKVRAKNEAFEKYLFKMLNIIPKIVPAQVACQPAVMEYMFPIVINPNANK